MSKVAAQLGGKALETTVITIPTENLPYHQKLEEALASEGSVTKARFSDYQMGYKDSDGEAQTHNLHASRFEVDFDTEPQWPPVNRIESVKLRKQERGCSPDGIERAFIFSDIQIPFEDESALEIALQVMAELKPDRVVFIGDLLDLNAWSRFEQLPSWATATQDAIIKAHQLLATVRKTLPKATIQLVEANHEARMPKKLLANAMAAYGLKRANQPEGWPVMSVPYLLALDDLDVEWVPGYPANRIYLSPDLQIIHGHMSGKNIAKRVSGAEKTSTIFGHDHRLSMLTETINTYDGGHMIKTYGIGALCRIDGHVPSTKSGRDVDGTPVRNLENWSQGFAVASYMPEGGAFHVEQVAIDTFHNYQTMYRGKIYEPRTL